MGAEEVAGVGGDGGVVFGAEGSEVVRVVAAGLGSGGRGMALSIAPAGSMPSCWAIWYSTGAVIFGTAVTGRKAASGNSQEVEVSLRQGLPR